MLLLLATVNKVSWAADRPFLYGIGPIALDEKRWTLDKTVADRVHVDTVTHKQTGKRILFIYRDYRDVSGDDHVAFFEHLVRGPNNDLTITGTPKVKEGAIAAGVLANYEAMRLEKVVIVVRPRDVQATVYISTADNPLEDPDLVEIQKLADATHLGR
jgi:hypothetical protein